MPASPSLLIVPARFKTGKLYTQIATTSAGVVLGSSGDFNVTRATTATRFNSAGLIESVASGVPRLDYYTSGGTAGCPALLVEPAATNGIRNNAMVGAVTGTPGTLPTGGGWSSILIGLTQTIVGVGAENGISYVDINFSGIATSTSALETRYESLTQIDALSGQAWTHSVYLKKIADPNPPANYRLNIYERTSGGSYVANGDLIIVPTTTIQRFTQTRTLSGGGTVAKVQPTLLYGVVSGSTYDFTLRIGYPQMELGSVATSVIPTTAAPVTRNADVISLSGAVSGCIGQTEGTIYAEVDIRAFNVGFIATISDGTASNRIEFYKFTGNIIYFDRISSTQSAATGLGSSALTAGIFKVAIAYKSGDTTMYINGTQVGAIQTQTFTFSSLTKINIGSSRSDGQAFNDRIRAAALYTTRLTNAQLQALTTL
jgi:hypothetical protein